MTPNPNPSPELPKCRYCGGVGKFQVVSSVSDGAWATCFCSRAALSQTLPAPGERERLRKALERITKCNPVARFSATRTTCLVIHKNGNPMQIATEALGGMYDCCKA